MSKNDPERARRLAEALRSNLRKRKDQDRLNAEAQVPPRQPKDGTPT